MKKFFSFTLLFVLGSIIISCSDKENKAKKEPISIKSPDGTISVSVDCKDSITYSITVDGEQVLSPSKIAMSLNDGSVLGSSPKVLEVKNISKDESITPPVGINAQIKDQYNETVIKFENGFNLIFRAYNDGIAYRFETTKDTDELIIKDEVIEYNFPEDFIAYPGKTDSMILSFEHAYLKQNLSSLNDTTMIHSPLLVKSAKGVNMLIAESDLLKYPGLFLKANKQKKNSLKAVFPRYPVNVHEVKGDGGWELRIPGKRENFIAKTKGKRLYPWRAMLIAKKDKDLLNNELIYKLAEASRIEKTDWIKPGQVAWDWWNGMTLTGVKFKPGINTATYKYNIDFASKNGIEYIVLDAGWADAKNMFKINPDVDMKYLFNYGKEKNVGLILWTTWFDLEDSLQIYLDTFRDWGAKGIKVDFFNRNDQEIVEKIEVICSEAAKRNLLVDLHGIYTMTGLNRTYPNMVTMEGVLGLEWNKWESGDPYVDGKYAATPRHDVTIPFIRMATGPMDYTPGAMINSNPETYKSDFMNPMSQGTRCHQLAMYPAYYSPLQMLSDEAPLYEKEPEVTSFITSVPETWDETKPLDGSVGEFLVIARRKGDKWFVSGLNDSNERSVTVDFSFLGDKKYTATLFEDGENVKNNPSSYSKKTQDVSKETKQTIKMAGGGGFAMSLVPLE